MKNSIIINKMGGESEWGTCEYCGNEGGVNRAYFRYDVNCECCGNDHHFEIVWHCGKCDAKDPGIRKIELSNELKHKI
jgi:hypothetical protein